MSDSSDVEVCNREMEKVPDSEFITELSVHRVVNLGELQHRLTLLQICLL